MTAPRLLVLLLLAPALSACTCPRRCCPTPVARGPGPVTPARAAQRPSPAPSPERAQPERGAPQPSEAWFRGDGTPTDLQEVLGVLLAADLVAFGELHGQASGAAAELAIFEALAASDRPVALAMEFFERDTQAALDAYLRGELEEAEFRKATRQGADYARTHGPLIELCKERGIPVIAANAPRRLVRAYRQTEDGYDDFLAAQSEQDRAYLPRETTILEDDYQTRFMALMGSERGPTFFRSQSLWDDAMAEAVADFRDAHPEHRVFLIVGGFHVTQGLGTISKYRMRRGKDEVRIALMSPARGNEATFTASDAGTADAILKVVMSKAPAPTAPSPHKPPSP